MVQTVTWQVGKLSHDQTVAKKINKYFVTCVHPEYIVYNVCTVIHTDMYLRYILVKLISNLRIFVL